MKGEDLSRDIEVLCENLERPDQGRVHFKTSGQEIDYLMSPKDIYIASFRNSFTMHLRLLRLARMGEFEMAGQALTIESKTTVHPPCHAGPDCFADNKFNTLKMRSQAMVLS